ncbi:MAG: YiiD C-terminal domain-containing protein [Desulfobacterales bacterium]
MKIDLDLDQFGKNIEFTRKIGLRAVQLDAEKVILEMPQEGNANHIGTMYAGALFTLAEVTGGAVAAVYLMKGDTYPIVKGLNIKFTRPANSNVRCEYTMGLDEAQKIMDECDKNKKADYNLNMQLQDKDGTVVAVAEGFYQLRKG